MEHPQLLPYRKLLGIGLNSLYYGTKISYGLGYDALTSGPWNVFTTKKRDIKPKCLQDEELGEHGFIQCKHQNLKLHYVAKGPKDKPLMLFLHGFPEMWYSWRHQIKDFSSNYRTVAIDMRGYGESEKPKGVAEYHTNKLTDDVKDVIEGLGYKSCILVGHDWGGIVAFKFSVKYPLLVNKLIVCNVPHPFVLHKHVETDKDQKKRSWYVYFFQIPYLPEIYTRTRDYKFIEDSFGFHARVNKSGWMKTEDLEAYKYTLSLSGALENAINYYRSAWRYQDSILPSERITETPTLMIWGTKDIFMGKETATLSSKYIDNFTLRFIEGATHWVQQERPRQVNKYIWEFLQNAPIRYSKL